MYCEQRIYNNVHICIVNREYTTNTYMYCEQRITQCTYIYNNVHICIVNREYTTMYIYVL